MSDEKKCKLNSYGTNLSIDTKDDHSEAPSNVFYPLNHQARRRRRTHFTSAQISELEGIFERIPYPGASIRNTISSNLGIPEDRIKVWFQNKRARSRRKKRRKANNVITSLRRHFNSILNLKLRNRIM